jgi:CDP-diglyceride synthetase
VNEGASSPASGRSPLPFPGRTLAGFAVQIVVVAVVIAALAALLSWRLIPYEALRAEDPARRFFVWEAVMWMFGLVSILFGVGALLETLDTSALRSALRLRVRKRRGSTAADGAGHGGGVRQLEHLALAPWTMIATGLALVTIASVMRALTPG